MISLPPSTNYQKQAGMTKSLVVDNAFATAEISLFGAHVISFKPKHDQRERLFVSEESIRDGSKAIRGGIPICWPWFGGLNEGYPMHGYARERNWDVLSVTERPEATEIVMSLPDTTGDGFSGEATLSVTLRVGRTLSISLQTTNVGNGAFELSTALHTYFSVSDINQVALIGMSGDYSDKANDWSISETPAPYVFEGYVDRIHLNPVKDLTITDSDHKIAIQSEGHDSIVVWNPGEALSISMTDMSNTGYVNMLCVETAVTQGKKLAPSEVHVLNLLVT